MSDFSAFEHQVFESAGLPLEEAVAKNKLHTLLSTDTHEEILTLSHKINVLIEVGLQNKRKSLPERSYLGASRLGDPCVRALQYEYTQTPRDQGLSGKTLRIFEMGHVIEDMALNWLREAGFEIVTRCTKGKPFGFSVANDRLQGHVDGIIKTAPPELDLLYPALWECKSMNAKNWEQTVEHGMCASKPIYAVQIALYQAYMESSFPGLSQHPALFTAVNKDTSDIYHELVPFDAALAQTASDRAVNLLRATEVGEILPRITTDPAHYVCRFCSWRNKCWKESLSDGTPSEGAQPLEGIQSPKGALHNGKPL